MSTKVVGIVMKPQKPGVWKFDQAWVQRYNNESVVWDMNLWVFVRTPRTHLHRQDFVSLLRVCGRCPRVLANIVLDYAASHVRMTLSVTTVNTDAVVLSESCDLVLEVSKDERHPLPWAIPFYRLKHHDVTIQVFSRLEEEREQRLIFNTATFMPRLRTEVTKFSPEAFARPWCPEVEARWLGTPEAASFFSSKGMQGRLERAETLSETRHWAAAAAMLVLL